MEQIFISLAIILLIAFLVSYILRLFRQPIIIGYILSGVLIAILINFNVFKVDTTSQIISIFTSFGIAFLLFIVGLHLNPKVIKDIGLLSLVVGVSQVIFTFVVSFFISWQILGFDIITSNYIGIALSFSSTIIVMKLLSDKMQLDSLYGKISAGILIVQDLIAMIVLIYISSFNEFEPVGSFSLGSVILGVLLIGAFLLLGIFAMPRLTKSFAHSQEILFLFSICWCFLVGAIFEFLGFTLEIGALIAGITLSLSPYSTEISSKIRPLRDFFLIIFFVLLGLNMDFSNLREVFFIAIILSIVVILLKSLIIMGLMALMGHLRRTNFVTGVTLAQISEFSFIIIALGISVGHLSQIILSEIVLTGLITMLISTYLIMYSDGIYSAISNFLGFFEKDSIKNSRKTRKKYNAVLFGYNRIGFEILKSIKNLGKNYVVIDFNPEIISSLKKFGIPCLYGDAYDSELLNELQLDKIEIAVSTLPGFETNKLLISRIRKANPKAIIIARAHQISNAIELYRMGASYVLTPHFLGGEHLAKMISNFGLSKRDYQDEKTKHLDYLEKLEKRGHEHPKM